MRAYELIGQVDAKRHLQVALPAGVPLPSDGVRVLVLLPESQDEDAAETCWAQGVAREWSAELADEREDIYSLTDGEPINAAR